MKQKLQKLNITTVEEAMDYLKTKINLNDFMEENNISYEDLTNFFKKII